MKKFTPEIRKQFFLFFFLGIASLHLQAQSYCTASGTLCTHTITDVTTAGENGGFSKTTGCETGNYGDYTLFSTSMLVSTAYQCSVTVNNVSGYVFGQVGIWVDWDNNGSFNEAGENVFTSSTYTGGSSVTLPFVLTPPSGAALGTTRMRVRTASTSGTLSPCGSMQYGEVEDYTVNVLSCSPAPATPGTIGGQSTVCASTSNTYTIAAVTGATTYSWTVPGGMNIISGQGSTSVLISTGSATGTISVTASNNCGESSAKIKSITVKPNPTANAGSDVSFCAGGSAQLSASGGAAYTWSPATGLSNPNISNPIASPVSAAQYTVTVATNGCTATDMVNVNVEAVPVADAGADVSICPGGGTQLSATGNGTYWWDNPAGLDDPTSSTPMATPASSVTYTLTVTASNGCTASDEVAVTVNTLPQADAGADATICAGSSTQLNASGGINYSWSSTAGLSDPTIANPTASPASSITYTVLVTDATGCSASDEVVITVSPAPMADPGVDVTICKGYSTQLNSGGPGGDTYLWAPATGLSNPNVSDPVANNSATTTYTLTVTNADGCSFQADVTVYVDLCNGISNMDQTAEAQAAPNPTSGVIMIEALFPISKLEMSNIQGQVIYSGRPDAVSRVAVDLSSMPKGVYFIHVFGNDGVNAIKKIVKE